MATPFSAASLAPGPSSYYLLDFSTAQTIPEAITSWDDEWRSAFIQPTDDLAFRADGTDPTGADGIVIPADAVWLFENQSDLLQQAIFFGGTARVQLFG